MGVFFQPPNNALVYTMVGDVNDQTYFQVNPDNGKVSVLQSLISDTSDTLLYTVSS